MQQRIIVLFLFGVILAVHVDCDSRNNALVDEIQTTNSVLIKYDKDLDKIVPFKELRASIEALEVMAENYHGPSKSRINQAIDVAYQATDNYFNACDTIFAWCVSGRTISHYIIEHQSHLSGDTVAKTTLRMLNRGFGALNTSIGILESTQKQLTQLHGILQPIPEDLKQELDQLKIDYEKSVAERNSKHILIAGLLGAFSLVATIILTFAVGPVGIAIGVIGALEAQGISYAVIQGIIAPSEEQKFKITRAYYESMIQTVGWASTNVTKVKEELRGEITYVTGLRGEVNGNLELVDIYNKSHLVEALKKLTITLHQYIYRHVGVTVKSRTRRDAHDFECDFDRISQYNEFHLNSTRKKRETQFWELDSSFGNAFLLMSGNGKFVL